MAERSGGIGKDTSPILYDEHRFQEYVLRISQKGTEGLQSIVEFPATIQPGSIWHESFERMRSDTNQDGHERYTLIGSRKNGDIYISEKFVVGEPNLVPYKVRQAEEDRAIKKYQVMGFAGDLHSHPGDSPFSPADLC